MTLRWMTAGESHGPGLTAILEGMVSGLELDLAAIDAQLARRQGGYGRGGRMKIETDRAQFTAGVRHGRTLGSPIAIHIPNLDHANWREIMAPFGAPPEPPKRVVTAPRPGHADLAGGAKHGRRSARRARARQRSRDRGACRGRFGRPPAARSLRVRIASHVRSLGAVDCAVRVPEDVVWEDVAARAAANDLACLDPAAYTAMVEAIGAARAAGDTLGGVVEVIATGLPPGLGSHVHWDRKLDGRIGQALLSSKRSRGEIALP